MLKRKHVVITVKDRYDIIKRLEDGETANKLAKEYKISKTTINEIRNKKTKIINFITQLNSTEGSLSRKSMKPPKDTYLDNALYTWFTQKRSQGMYISGTILREMAMEFNQLLGGPSNFQASSGWLKNFKNRHSLKLPTQGKKLYVSSSAAVSYKIKLLDMLREEGYSLKNVYNADETCLNWKALPRRTLDVKPDPEGSVDRITAMLCANANGSHRLPMLVIGKNKKPLCFKHINMSAIPIVYTSQTNACMDSTIFTEWFLEVFVPCVKARQLKNGKREKILLLIDNAPTHPSCDILNKNFEFIKVMFVPSNATSLQPMEHGVADIFKGFYKKILLRRLLLEKQEKGEESLLQIHNIVDLKDASYMIGEAWNSVTEQSLKKAWNGILAMVDNNSTSESEIEERNNLPEILDMLKELNYYECDEEDVQEWISADGTEVGHEIMQNSGNADPATIIASGSNSVDTLTNNSEDNDEHIPVASEALTCVETALRWLKAQWVDENNLSQLIPALEKVRDLAARKRV